MSFEDFQQALLRIGIKGKAKLDVLAEKMNSKAASQKEISNGKDIKPNKRRQSDDVEEDEKIDEESENAIVENGSVDQEPNIQSVDTYKSLDEMTPKTLETLILHLELPEDKNGILLKINEKKSQNAKAVAPRTKKKILSSKINERDESREKSANNREPAKDAEKVKSKNKGKMKKLQKNSKKI